MAQIQQVLEQLYQQTRSISEGKVASYIPQLARVDPNQYGVAVCFLNGEEASWGQSETDFCLQSVCKPINYALALEELGEEQVHQHVGFEPSGSAFNALTLNQQGLPHNPLINSGGIMCASLIQNAAALSDRFGTINQSWAALSGGLVPGFDNAVYQSERAHADRNYALAHFMREQGAFPANTSLENTLELYFQACSITVKASQLARVGATLASGGHCVFSQKQIISPRNLRHVLTVMAMCGMYDYSGEFAFRIGVPAKSGVSGALLIVVPGLMGLAIWSPPLDHYGNSVRGVSFCQELVKKLPLHVYEQWPAQRNSSLLASDHDLDDSRLEITQ